MFKNVIKVQYHWHSFRQLYHKMLMNDCLCNEIRAKLQGKATYHEKKALSLIDKM